MDGVSRKWLSNFPEARNRQLRHILPHLLFPDLFERISSEKDKWLILASNLDVPEKEIRKWIRTGLIMRSLICVIVLKLSTVEKSIFTKKNLRAFGAPRPVAGC
ncbi:hypothetical protein [Mesorhizobium onobrychidis]|uniref:hypothetical protein n=1 Tax=Mesorhizobium onobrychidis TaxID=2775404 RepID=UPI0021582218|nr:hypothetical protein [Mesorhizobium onobrychidis]